MKKEENLDDNLSDVDQINSRDAIAPDQWLMKHLTMMIMFIFDYDPFAIYKENHKQHSRAKYRQYLRPGVKMQPTNWDVWRSRLRIINICWLTCLSCKYAYLCCLQVIIYNILQSRPGGFSGVQNVWITNATDSLLDDQSRLVLSLKYSGELVGNILSDYPGIALIIYLALSVSVSSATYFLPLYYHRKPIDSPSLRNGLNPTIELKRIDTLLDEIISAHLLQANQHMLSELTRLNHHRTSTMGLSNYAYHGLDSSAFKTSYPYSAGGHAESLALKFKSDRSLRPVNYSPNYTLSMWFYARIVVYCIVPSMLIFYLQIQITLLRATTVSRCETKRIDPCRALDAFTFLDWYSLTEIISQMYVAGFIITFQLIMILMSSFSQLILANEMQSELSFLSDTLRRLLDYRTIHGGQSNDDHKQLLVIYENKLNDQHEAHLLEVLWRTLIKVSILNRDMRSEAVFITEQTTSALGITGSLLLIALFTGQMKVIDMHGLRRSIIRGVWVMGNIVVIRCANVYARIVRVNGISWSILAQLSMIRQTRLSTTIARDSTTITVDYLGDYLDSSWRRLILSQYLLDRYNSVRPLGVSLTYKKVLEINFFIVSLVALLWRPI